MAAPETPNSRKETYYDSILKDGDTGLTPNSREEMYLDAIDRDLDDIRAELAKKSESIPLEYRGNKIYRDGVEIDFEGIKALMGDHDNDIDLHADNDTIMRITAFADDAIEFSTTYITGGKVYVDRVIINSDNDIKFDEIETGGGGDGMVLLTTAVENNNIMLKYNGSEITFFDIQDFIEAGKPVEILYNTLRYRLTYHAHNGIMFFTGLTPISGTTYQIYQLSIAYQGSVTAASAQFSKVSFSVTQG